MKPEDQTQTNPDHPDDLWTIVRIRVEKQRRSNHRLIIELADGRQASFSPEIVVRERLRVGDILASEQQWTQLLAGQAEFDARQRLIAHLSARRKTRREAEAYLTRLGYDDHAVEHAVNSAAELGYLDDAAFAGAYARTKDNTRKEGPRSISAGLFRRGVDKELVDEAVAPLESEEVQFPKALALGEKKWAGQQSNPKSSSLEQRKKLTSFLLRRGFTPSVVHEAVKKITGRRVDEDESAE